MQLHPHPQPRTAFIISSKRHFHCGTSTLGLLGCTASYQKLMVFAQSILFLYILVIFLFTQETMKITSLYNKHGQMHLWQQGRLLLWFHTYPRSSKTWLKLTQEAKPPTDMKTITWFVGLCNFFSIHFKDFAIIAVLLFKLTCKESGYKSRALTKDAMDAFNILKSCLTSE